MEKFKGTPAPWFQSHREGDDGMYSTQVYDKDGKTICTLEWYGVRKGDVTTSKRPENAKLIAAAPDLLSALNVCFKSLMTYGDHPIIKKQVEKALTKALN